MHKTRPKELGDVYDLAACVRLLTKDMRIDVNGYE